MELARKKYPVPRILRAVRTGLITKPNIKNSQCNHEIKFSNANNKMFERELC